MKEKPTRSLVLTVWILSSAEIIYKSELLHYFTSNPMPSQETTGERGFQYKALSFACLIILRQFV